MSTPTEPIGSIPRHLPSAHQRTERELISSKEALERKTEELRISEQRFRATFNQAAVGIAVATLDGRFVEANQKFADILGYPPQELRELTFLGITHPQDFAATAAAAQDLIGGKIPHYILEKRYLRKDGGLVWSRTTVTLLRDAAGAAEQFIGIIEDITERKRAEEIGSRLAAVVESSDDAIISKTLEGRIVTWNHAAERMFGYCAAEVIGQSITLLIPAHQPNEEPSILERLKRGERIEHYETVRQRKDGTLFDVSLSVSPIKDAMGTIIGASKIARDISRQKQTEEALRETDRRKDEFLATLAHELRNPLAPIRQAALISKSPAASEAQKRWSHDVISRQVHHMALLLEDLLDISRVTRGMLELRIEMTELTTVIDAAVETARPTLDAKRHLFSMELPPEPVYFAADPLRLAQVLSNLLTNAAKYTDPRGRIRLRAECDAQTVTIGIEDSGIGIPPAALANVFTMFSQVKSNQDRSEGGLGIGLALAKGLVELHGGTIEARSAGAGQGSEFIVRLPLRTLDTPCEEPTNIPAARKSVSRRVLIADDNKDAAQSLALLLQMEGHEVTVVHDGKQALAAFASMQPQVMLLDIGMPEMDGYEVARRVRQGSLGRAVTLIAVTGWGQDSDKNRALAAGFNHHFTKPVEPARLIELLRAESQSG